MNYTFSAYLSAERRDDRQLNVKYSSKTLVKQYYIFAKPIVVDMKLTSTIIMSLITVVKHAVLKYTINITTSRLLGANAIHHNEKLDGIICKPKLF